MEEGENPPRLPHYEDSQLSVDDSLLSVEDDKFANRYLTTASDSDSDSDEISDSSVDSIVPEPRPILRKPFVTNTSVLIVEPDEIVFENVQLKKTYTATIKFSNPMESTVHFEIKSPAGQLRQYDINPSLVQLKSKDSVIIEIKMRLLQPLPKLKQNIKDTFHIKSEFFDQQFHVLLKTQPTSPQIAPKEDKLMATMDRLLNTKMNKLGKNAPGAVQLASEQMYPKITPNPQQRTLEDLQMKLLQSQSDVEYLTKLTEKLQANMPDLPNIVATMLARERQEHERKDQKVLETLRAKDEKIQTLTAELEATQFPLKETKKQLKQARAALTLLESKYTHETYQLRDLLERERETPKIDPKIASKISQIEEKEQKQRDIVQKLEKSLSELETSRTQLTDELNHYKSQSVNLQKSVEEKDKVISELQATIISQNRQIEQSSGEGAQQVNDLLEKVHILENINETLEISAREAQKVYEDQTEQFRRKVQELSEQYMHNVPDGNLLEQQRSEITELEIQVSELEVAVKIAEGEKMSLAKQLDAIKTLKPGSTSDHYQEMIHNFQKENSLLIAEKHQLVRELRDNFKMNEDTLRNNSTNEKERKEYRVLLGNLYHNIDQLKTANQSNLEKILILETEKKDLEYYLENVTKGKQEEIDDLKHNLSLERNAHKIKISNIEAALQVLSSKSTLHSDLANSLTEIGSLKILNARLSDDHKYVDGKLANYKHELKDKTNQLQQLQKKLLKTEYTQTRDSVSDNETIAALTLKCDKQQEEITNLESQLKDARSMTTTTLSSTATSSKLEDKKEDHRLLESKVMEIQEQLQLLQIENSKLTTIVQNRELEINQYQKNILELEQAVIESREAAERAVREEELKFLRELTNKEAIVSELSHKVELFAIQESKLEAADKQNKLEIEIVKSYYTDSQKQLENKYNTVQEKYSILLAEHEMMKAEIEKYKNIIDERALQINILMETIQTLQGTDPKEQQIVNLTSQLNLARSTEAGLERRIVELNADVAVHLTRANAASSQLQEVANAKYDLEHRLDSLQKLFDQVQKEKTELSSVLRVKDKELQDMNKTVDRYKELNTQHTKQLQLYQHQLIEQRNSHIEKLQRERLEFQEEIKRITEDNLSPKQIRQQQQQVFGSVLKELTSQLEKLNKKFKRSKNAAELYKNSNTITNKIQDLIIEQWVNYEQTNRDKRSYEWQAKYFSNKLLATEQITEKLYSELKISETMALEISKNYREQLEMQESHSASHIALLNSQLSSLAEQSEKLKQMCLTYESQSNQLQIQAHNLSDQNQLLEKKLASFEMERKAAFADARAQIQDEIQDQLDERDITLKNYFDSEIVRILSINSGASREENIKVQLLTRQLIAFQLSQSHLLSQIVILQKKFDTMKFQYLTLKQLNEHYEKQVLGLDSKISPKPVPNKEKLFAIMGPELFKLQNELLVATQQNEKLKTEIDKLNASQTEEKIETTAQFQTIHEEFTRKYERDVEKLNRQLLEQKGEHINHLNSLKVEFELERDKLLLQEKRKFEKEKLSLENHIVDLKSRLDSSTRISGNNKEQTSLEIISKYADLQIEVDNTKTQIKVLKDLNSQLQKDFETLQRSEGAELFKAYITSKMKESELKQKLKVAAKSELELREQLAEKESQLKEHPSDHSTMDSSSNSTDSSGYEESVQDLRKIIVEKEITINILKKRLAEEIIVEESDSSNQLLLKSLEQIQTENSNLKKELVKLSVDLNQAKRFANIQEESQGVDILTRTIQNLTNQIKEKEELISSLQSKISETENVDDSIDKEGEVSQKKLEKWKTAHKTDKATIKKLKESNDIMSRRTNEMQAVIVGLTKKLEDQTSSTNSMVSQDTFTNIKQQLLNEIDQYKTQVLALQNTLSSLRKSIGRPERISDELTDLHQRVEQLKLMEANYLKKIQNLEQTNKNLSTKQIQLDQIKSKLAELELQLHSKNLESLDINEQLLKYQQELEIKTSELFKTRSALQNVSRLYEELKVAHNQTEQIMEQYKSNDKAHQGQIGTEMSNLQNDILALKKQLDVFEMERDHLIQEHQFLLQRTNQYYEQYTNLHKQCTTDEEKRQAEMQAYKNKLTSITEFYEKQVKQLQQQLKEAQSIWKQQMHQAVQFSEGQFQKEIQLLDEQTQNLQQRYDSQLDEFRNLKLSHDNWMGQCQGIEREFSRYKEDQEKVIQIYEQQILALKEKLANIFNARMGNQSPSKLRVAMDTIDLVSQVAEKDAQILVLHQELSSIKKLNQSGSLSGLSISQTPIKAAESITTAAKLSQMQHLVSITKMQVDIEKQEKASVESRLQQQNETNEALKDKVKSLAKEIADLQKKRKEESNKLTEDIEILRKTWRSPEEWTDLTNQLKNAKDLLKTAQDNNAKKAKMLESIKGDKDQHAGAIEQATKDVKQTEEKLKKALKELNRKDQIIIDLKQKLESVQQVDKPDDDKKKNFEDKYKSLSSDYTRKDQLAKELKTRLEAVQHEAKTLGEEKERYLEVLKKTKLQLERKEALLVTTKDKLEQTMRELDGYKLSSGFTSNDIKTRKLQKEMADIHLEIRDSLQLINELKTTIFQVGQTVVDQIGNIPANVEQKKAPASSIDAAQYIPTDIMSAEDLNDIMGSTSTNNKPKVLPRSKKRTLQSAENYLNELEILLDGPFDSSRATNVLLQIISERIIAETC